MNMNREMTVNDVRELPWFRELTGLIEADVRKAREAVQADGPRIDAEIDKLQSALRGWSMTLADPNINSDVRALVQSDMTAAQARLRDLKADKESLESAAATAVAALDPEDVVRRLNTLTAVLGGENATRTNVELARHIEAVRCYPDGRVVLRSCKFGAFYLEDLERNAVASDATGGPDGPRRPKPRRRSTRRLVCEDAGPELRAAADWATDIERFAGLDDDWFWEDEFRVPETTHWFQDHAADVARLRKEDKSHDELCVHFGVTAPTIRKALKYASKTDPELAALPRKKARARWQDSHYEEVAAMKARGMAVPAIAKYFGVSEPLVYWALDLAAAKANGRTGDDDAA